MLNITMFGIHNSTEVCVKFLLENNCNVLWAQPNGRPFNTKIQHDNLHHYEYATINSDGLHEVIRGFGPDYILSMILWDKIPQTIVKLAKKYGMNFHPADLPEVRTGNGWFWPIRLMKTQSAIAVHLLEEEWDAGPIVYKQMFDLHPYETQATYTAKVVSNAAPCIKVVYELMASGQIHPIPQGKGRYYPRLRIKDMCLNWEEPAKNIEAHIRASNPFQFAFTYYKNYSVEVGEADVTDIPATTPGEIRIIDGDLYVSASDFFLKLTILFCNGCFSGKRFIAMYNVSDGDFFIDARVIPLVRKNLENTQWVY